VVTQLASLAVRRRLPSSVHHCRRRSNSTSRPHTYQPTCLSTGSISSAWVATSKPTAPPTAQNPAAWRITRRHRHQRPALPRALRHRAASRPTGPCPGRQQRPPPSSTCPQRTTSPSPSRALAGDRLRARRSRRRHPTPVSARCGATRPRDWTPRSCPRRPRGSSEHTPARSNPSASNAGARPKARNGRPRGYIVLHFPSTHSSQQQRLYPTLNRITHPSLEAKLHTTHSSHHHIISFVFRSTVLL